MRPSFFLFLLIGLVLFSFTGCTKDRTEPIPRYGFKFVDIQGESIFPDYQTYLQNKPDSFYDKPYLVNEEGTKVNLKTQVLAFASNPGLSFYYERNLSNLEDLYGRGVENVPNSLVWTVHFSENRIDTVHFGFSRELAQLLDCDLDAFPIYRYAPAENMIGWKFLAYNRDTILTGCPDNPQLSNLILLDASSDELLIQLTK